MTERKLVLQVVIGRRELVVLAALALLAFHPAALSTEQLTMTTYYPSPYGVYNQMRTTNNAYLAYTAGSGVHVGANTPPTGTNKLQVQGGSLFNGDTQATQNAYLATTAGTVGVGTASPPGGNKLHVQGTSRFTGNGQFDTMVTALQTVRAQGGNGSMAVVGDVGGMDGIYSESGDMVVSAASNRVRIGNTDTQVVGNACRTIAYGFGYTATCPVGWSVYSFGNGGGVMFNSPGGAAIGMPTTGDMFCCKLSSN